MHPCPDGPTTAHAIRTASPDDQPGTHRETLLCPRTADGDVYSGDITDANLATQINVLNNAYANAGVSPDLSCIACSCARFHDGSPTRWLLVPIKMIDKHRAALVAAIGPVHLLRDDNQNLQRHPPVREHSPARLVSLRR